MSRFAAFRAFLALFLLPYGADGLKDLTYGADGVKELFTHKAYTDLIAEAGNRPVIMDYYSDWCGSCHRIAPVYRKISKEFAGRAYFRKVNVDRNHRTADQEGIRSLPSFQFYLNGKKRHQFSGADEHSLREWTRRLVEEADHDDVAVSRDDLEARKLVQLLKKKYGEAPKTTKRPQPTKPDTASDSAKNAGGAMAGANLGAATLEELQRKLERLKQEIERREEEAEERWLSRNPCNLYRNRTDGMVEKVVIIGGGPAGMTAAIYAARANLCPLLIAPAFGGQLLAKGVDVGNYPGMPRKNGGKMIEIMQKQARSFFAEVRDEAILSINTSSRPFRLVANSSGVVQAHSVILATGAASRWLHAEGEYELRGQGVSTCAACDGYRFKGKPCAVVGGGDTAMEEALMLSRICSSVDLIVRRDQFRASLVLQERVLSNPNIRVRRNRVIERYVGKAIKTADGETLSVLSHIELRDSSDLKAPLTDVFVDATFVAIGRDPNTGLVSGQLEMDEGRYLTTQGKSTLTSVPGVFAAGDVSDHVYQQAVTAAGSGAMAAMDAEKFLSEQRRVRQRRRRRAAAPSKAKRQASTVPSKTKGGLRLRVGPRTQIVEGRQK